MISLCHVPSTVPTDELFDFRYSTHPVGRGVSRGELVSMNDSRRSTIRSCFPKVLTTPFILIFLQQCSETKFAKGSAAKINGKKKQNEPSCHSLYTDGVLAALFTPVSDQVGAVSSVLELHLGLVSLHGPCKPEAAVINDCT